MKKLNLLLVASLLITITTQAQLIESRYDFEYETGATYTPLGASATTIPFDPDWDDEISDPITMPFDFYYQNVKVDNIIVETFGSLLLNGVWTLDEEAGHILGINTDYEAKGRGKVKYESTGSVGNRIFKIEFANVGLYVDSIGDDSLNFQYWLYENGNKIEYRVGPQSITSGITFCIDFDDDACDDYILLGLIQNEGDVIIDSPYYFQNVFTDASSYKDTFLTSWDFTTPLPLVSSFPDEGTIFRFTPDSATAIHPFKVDMASVYPNPSQNGIFQIQLKQTTNATTTYQVYDMMGKVVMENEFKGQQYALDLSGLSSANYILKLKNNNQISTLKLSTLK